MTIEDLDVAFASRAQHLRTGPGEMFFQAITHLGDRMVLPFVAFGLFLVLWLTVRFRTAFIYLSIVVCGGLLSEGTKHLVSRPRPATAADSPALEHSPSFPSGHSLNSAVIYGLFAVFVVRAIRPRKWRWGILSLVVLLVLLIGLSRVFLGVHYPLDVLAGWSAGLALVMLGTVVHRQRSARLSPDSQPPSVKERGPGVR